MLQQLYKHQVHFILLIIYDIKLMKVRKVFISVKANSFTKAVWLMLRYYLILDNYTSSSGEKSLLAYNTNIAMVSLL
jgi:hypothetical protein